MKISLNLSTHSPLAAHSIEAQETTHLTLASLPILGVSLYVFPVVASVLFPGAVFLHFPWLPERPDCNEGWLIFVKPPNTHPFLNVLVFLT